MKVNIQAIHFDVADRLVEFINKKAERLGRRFPAIMSVDVTLKLVKPETAQNKEVVVKIDIPGAPNVSKKTANTFEEAFDLALEAAERQLGKAPDKK